LICYLLLLSALIFECGGVQLSLTRNIQKRQDLLKFARDNLGLSDEQRLPLEYQVNSPFQDFGRNTTRPSRVTSTQINLLGGTALGEVYADFTIGTPPQLFSGQIDTGSSDLGLPVRGCKNCGKAPNMYKPQKSTTSVAVPCTTNQFTCPKCHANQCGYAIRYLDKSGFRAVLYTDDMTIGGLTVGGASVGGIYTEKAQQSGSGSFEPANVDGILGMAYQKISETNSPTFMDLLVSSNQVDDVFSMCLTENGGAMELGGTINSFNSDPAFTALRTPHYFYAVTMNDFLVGDTSVGLPSTTYNSDGTIFDSGTTALAVPTAVYQKVFDILTASCTTTPLVGICGTKAGKTLFDNFCYKMTPDQLALFPTLKIQLDGVTLEIPPQNWILDNYCSKPGYYSILLYPVNQNGVILGDVVHRVYTVIYDRANSQIGVAPTTNCPSSV